MKNKQLNTDKYSNFLPHNSKYKDTPIFSLGDEFHPDVDKTEGFDKTGKYFFVFENNRDEDDDHSIEMTLHVVSFNEKTMSLERKVWRIHTNDMDDIEMYGRKSYFDVDDGVIMHIIYWKSLSDKGRPEQLVVDLYYFNVFDILNGNVFDITKSNHLETRIDDSRQPDIKLRYTLEDYNCVEFFFKFNEKTCIVKAFHVIDTEVNQPDSFLPACCLDSVYWNENGKFWHSKIKEIDLSHSTVYLCHNGDLVDNYILRFLFLLPSKNIPCERSNIFL